MPAGVDQCRGDSLENNCLRDHENNRQERIKGAVFRKKLLQPTNEEMQDDRQVNGNQYRVDQDLDCHSNDYLSRTVHESRFFIRKFADSNYAWNRFVDTKECTVILPMPFIPEG